MTAAAAASARPSGPAGRAGAVIGSTRVYRIRVAGRLDARWSSWFDGLDVRSDQDGSTSLTGPVADQAALHGLLTRVRDLGLELLSVTQETD